MSRRHSNGGKGFAFGALFGGLVGGITALLFAPKSGNKMRKDLAKKYHAASDKAHDLLEDMCDQTGELVERAKEIASDAREACSKITKSRRK